MLEIVGALVLLMTLANMASERRLNVAVICGVGAIGWLVLAVLFRYLVSPGVIPAVAPWVFMFGLVVYVQLQAIPKRSRTYEGIEELSQSLAEAKQESGARE